MRPKKSLGQNFLHSTAARNAIIGAAKLDKPMGGGEASAHGATILEIGPGKGFLTEALLQTGAKVVAIEKDDALFVFLQEKFSEAIQSSQLEIIHGDVLEWGRSGAEASPPPLRGSYKLVANIPYNITGEIIRTFLETPPSGKQPEMMVLMLQKEVAERIVGLPRKSRGEIKESILSISVKAFGEPKYIQTVRAGSFFPIPKVDSAILAIENIQPLSRFDLDETAFFKILHLGFSHKRKLLKSNLGCSTETLEKCNINPQARAENLNLNQWTCLTHQLTNHSESGK